MCYHHDTDIFFKIDIISYNSFLVTFSLLFPYMNSICPHFHKNLFRRPWLFVGGTVLAIL